MRLVGLALLVGIVAWSKSKTTALLQDVAGLRLEKVSVEGNRYLSEDEVIKAAALPQGESMFKLDLEQATERIKQIDWVDHVFIEEGSPDLSSSPSGNAGRWPLLMKGHFTEWMPRAGSCRLPCNC